MEARAHLADPARGRHAGVLRHGRFPVVYGALAPTKPLNEDTVRRWYELGSYTKLLRTTARLWCASAAPTSLATAAARRARDHPAADHLDPELGNVWGARLWAE